MRIVVWVGLLLLMALAVVWAQSPPSATVSWLAPIAYSGHDVLPATDIDHYTVSWSRTANGPVLGTVSVKAPALSAVVPVDCGTYQFSITITTGSGAVFPNAISDSTGPVPFVSGVSCKPNPPGALAVH